MSVAANMNFIWGAIADKSRTMIQTDQGPMRIFSIRSKAGVDMEIMAVNNNPTTTPSSQSLQTIRVTSDHDFFKKNG